MKATTHSSINTAATTELSLPERLGASGGGSRSPVPAKVDPAPGRYVNGDQYSLVLAPHTLYVENEGSVWTTPIPSAPPRPKRSH